MHARKPEQNPLHEKDFLNDFRAIAQQTSLKTEKEIGEFDAGERLFMKNKFVFLELCRDSLNDNSKNKKHLFPKECPK